MKLPFRATLFTLLGILILCGLGIWQLQRLSWKTGLLAAMETAYATDPMTFEFTAQSLAALQQDKSFVRGFAEGIFLHDSAILLGPRTHDGLPGYHVITPFETLDNTILLVNRGWIPLDSPTHGFSRPAASMIITGILRKPEKSNMFVPENVPDKDQWYRLDPAAIANAKALENVLADYILYADQTVSTQPYPLAQTAQWRPPNNHLSYALFWFSMAAVLAVIYGLRFLRTARS